MSVDVKLKDLGFAAAVKRTHELHGKGVKVGYQVGKNSTKGDDGKTIDVMDIAIWNEYGTRTAPPRPFMAQTASKNKPAVGIAMSRVAEAVKLGARTPDSLLGELGEFYVALIRREIASGDFVANAEYTKKRKKSTKPLVDTGRVLSPAVRWEIER